MPVAHRLAQRDEVRRQPEVAEPPQIPPTPPEPRLYFVREEQPATRSYFVLQALHELADGCEDAGTAEDTVDGKQRHVVSSIPQHRTRGTNPLRRSRTVGLLSVGAEPGRLEDADVRWSRLRRVCVRRPSSRCLADAVVREIGDNRTGSAGDQLGHSPG